MKKPIPRPTKKELSENQIKAIKAIADRWKSNIVSRREVELFTGGAVTARNLANLDCKGEGPDGSFYIGRNRVYPVNAMVDWLISRATA